MVDTLRAEKLVKINTENMTEFQKAISRALRQTNDLRIPFGLIARDFYTSEKAIFKLKGPGGYKDLTRETKASKLRLFGFIYPILRATGALEKSVTTATHPNSLLIITKKDVTIGTTDPVAVYHNSDRPRTKMPQRKIVFIGPEVSWFHQRDQQKQGGRLTRWTTILERFTVEKTVKSFRERGLKDV